MDILGVVEQECDNRCATLDENAESLITGDLDAQLQALMLESQGADGAAGCAATPGPQESTKLLAIKEEMQVTGCMRVSYG